jgi:phenylacetate-CoA ligase
MIILRGVNVFPTQIEEQIMAVESLSPHFQIELTRAGRMDAMVVHVEATAEAASEEACAASALALGKKIKSMVGVSALVDVTEPGAVVRSQGKAVRVVDNRPKAD